MISEKENKEIKSTYYTEHFSEEELIDLIKWKIKTLNSVVSFNEFTIHVSLKEDKVTLTIKELSSNEGK